MDAAYFDLIISGTIAQSEKSYGLPGDVKIILEKIQAGRSHIVAVGAPYRVLLRSDGGAVSDCVAIYTALRALGRPIQIWCEHAFGAATIILAAGDVRRATHKSLMAIMRPWLQMTIRSREEGIEAGEALDKTRVAVIDLLAGAGFGTREQVSAWMDKDTYMDSAEALKAGWIHEVVDADLRLVA